MSFVTANRGQYSYFDAQLGRPDWRGKTVLDFGGNVGNLLADPHCRIDPARYWCLDVSRDAIALGAAAHPGAHFVFYDRQNVEFNPGGIPGLGLPEIGPGFNFILALSVFTHTSRAEMIELIGALRARLDADGTLAFTFLDPHHAPPDGADSNLVYFAARFFTDRQAKPTPGYLRQIEAAAGARWCTLLDEGLHIEADAADPHPLPADAERTRYLTLYTAAEVHRIFPAAEIVAPVAPFLRHHCCLLKGPAR